MISTRARTKSLETLMDISRRSRRLGVIVWGTRVIRPILSGRENPIPESRGVREVDKSHVRVTPFWRWVAGKGQKQDGDTRAACNIKALKVSDSPHRSVHPVGFCLP